MKKTKKELKAKRDTILTCRTFESIKEKVDRAANEKKLTRNQYLETIILTALESKGEMALN